MVADDRRLLILFRCLSIGSKTRLRKRHSRHIQRTNSSLLIMGGEAAVLVSFNQD